MLVKYSTLVCILVGQFIVQGIKIKVTDVAIEEFDPEFLKMDIKLRQENDKSLVDVNADLLKDLDSDLFLQIHVQVKGGIGNGLLTVYKSDVVDRCHFVENKEKYQIFKEFFHKMEHYGNLMQPCPLKKGHYYLNGFILEPSEMLSKALVPGEYFVHTISLRKFNGEMKTLYSVKFQCNMQ